MANNEKYTVHYDEYGNIIGRSEEYESRNLVTEALGGIAAGLSLAIMLPILYFIGEGIGFVYDHSSTIFSWIRMLCVYGGAPIALLIQLVLSRNCAPELKKVRNIHLLLTTAAGLALSYVLMVAFAEFDTVGESFSTYLWCFAPAAAYSVLAAVTIIIHRTHSCADFCWNSTTGFGCLTFVLVLLSHIADTLNTDGLGIIMTILSIILLTLMTYAGALMTRLPYTMVGKLLGLEP